jgi:hypothetical protein
MEVMMEEKALRKDTAVDMEVTAIDMEEVMAVDIEEAKKAKLMIPLKKKIL